MAAIIAANTMIGTLTVYGGEFVGERLYCSTQSIPLYYDSDSPKWIALDSKQLGITWQCWDLIYVPGKGMFRALDSGPFGDHCVAIGDRCPPIVADVPVIHATWEGLSIEGEFVNFSAIVRECRERGLCD